MRDSGIDAEMSGGQAPNDGPETVPREAATVMLLRGGTETLEVLLVRRSPHARFMANVWVFPGGAVDRDEERSPHAHRIAALRELQEEANVQLSSHEDLVEFSRWITPAEVKIRFDTRFFVAELPEGQKARVDGGECVDLRWVRPVDALEAHGAGEIALVFPTIKHLERLIAYGSAGELLRDAASFDVSPVQPRVVLDAGQRRVLLPGEAGY
jgi:8-oxo-dGTP pyrophosphatase MutT (NUDIX family)